MRRLAALGFDALLRSGLLAALLAVSIPCSKAAGPSVVQIGFAAPLTGRSAADGKEMENAARLALEDANQRAPKIAGRPVQFELVSLDDQGDPRVATQVAQRLADFPVAGVVGHFNSGCSIAASGIYQMFDIAEVSPSSTSAAYTRRGNRSSFRVIGHDAIAGAELGRYLIDTLESTRIAIIDDRTDFGQGLADRVSDFIVERRGKIVAREYVTDKTVDFSAVLTRIRGQNADVVVFGGFDAQAALVVRRMRGLGMKAILAGEGFNNNTFLKLASGDGDGTVTIQPGLPVEKMPAKDFPARYKARFKAEPEGFQGPYAYDAASVLVHAVMEAQSVKPAEVLSAVMKTRLDGITGPIAFDERGDLAASPYTVYRLSGGRWIQAKVMVAPGD